jgi:hypothetical protein
MISLALSFFIVLATYFIRSVPDARHHVDRISWRLFTKAMGVQMVFVVAYLVMYVRRDVSGSIGHLGRCTHRVIPSAGTSVLLDSFRGSSTSEIR